MSIITDVFGLSLSSIFNLFVLAKYYHNFKLYYLRFCETKLNLICYNKNQILPADTKLKTQESRDRDGMGKPICKLHKGDGDSVICMLNLKFVAFTFKAFNLITFLAAKSAALESTICGMYVCVIIRFVYLPFEG